MTDDETPKMTDAPYAPAPAPNTMTRVLDGLATACRTVAITGLVIITLVQAWQVFGRYVLNNSPGWTEPVAVFFMALTVMLAGAVGIREGTHFNFPNVREALPPIVRAALETFLHALTFVTAITLSVWGAQLAASTWDIAMAGAALPAGLRYLPLALGGAIMAIFALERLFDSLRSPKEV